MKKIVAIIIAITLFCACAVSVGAATGITADEKKILDALDKEITMASGTVVALPDKYVNQAKDYLTKAELTPEQITDIMACIEDARKTVEASKADSLSHAEAAVKEQVVADAKAAAEVINANLSVTKIPVAEEEGKVSANYVCVLTFDENSNVEGYTAGTRIELSAKSDEIEQTGAEGSMTATVVGSAILLAGVAFVVIASRKKAFDK